MKQQMHESLISRNRVEILIKNHGRFGFNMQASFYQISPPVLPKPPSSLWITEVSPNTVHLKWNPGNSDPVDSYIIRFRPRYSHPDNFSEITNIGQDTTDYHIHGLSAYTEYEFRVYAVNKLGKSASSTPVDVVTGELGRCSDTWNRYISQLFFCAPFFVNKSKKHIAISVASKDIIR